MKIKKKTSINESFVLPKKSSDPALKYFITFQPHMSDSKADRIAKFVSVMKCRYKNFFSRIRLPVKKKKKKGRKIKDPIVSDLMK